jgi:hypothetical protein
MRVWRLAAGAVAMILTHVAPASGEASVPAGLGGGTDAGGVPGGAVQSGSFLDATYRNPSTPVGLTGDRKPKLRRLGSMMDYYPSADGEGLHFSAGFRTLARKGRGAFNPFRPARPNMLIYTPAVVNTLPISSGVKRNSPAFSMGWNRAVDSRAMIGFEAGTTMDHGGGRNLGLSPSPRWSRVDPVAQASFALRF